METEGGAAVGRGADDSTSRHMSEDLLSSPRCLSFEGGYTKALLEKMQNR